MSSGNNQEGFSNISLPDFGNVDINKLAKKPSSNQPEFITTHARGREFSSLLVFSTGHFWMAGYGFGTLYGAVQGWRQAVNPNFKVRLNAVMNGASSNAAKIGNPLGVLAVMHTIFVKVADEALARAPAMIPRDDNTVYSLAGFATGALYKSTTGVRGAGLAAIVGTVASLVYLNGSSWVYYNLNKHKLHF